MEQHEISATGEEQQETEQTVRPALALAMEDVGNLDAVLRGYYLSQIKSLEKRKDRKLARRLLEDHLVLPKSRQRTSKDAAYIKETLEVEHDLLVKLEDSRLIRRIHKSGNNPIYEISHDTLVEPILSEKRDREAIARFIRRTWKYAALLLLLWFLCGMWFENSFEVLPTIAKKPQVVRENMNKLRLDVGENTSSMTLSLPAVVIDRKLKPNDSIFIRLPIEATRIASLTGGASAASDTIAIQLMSPIEVPLGIEERPLTYQTFSNIVVPLTFQGGANGDEDAKPVYAKLSGNLKMTNNVLIERGVSEYDNGVSSVRLDLGDTLVQAGRTARSIPVNFSLRLTDFFDSEQDKNSIRNTLGDRLVDMNYTVEVQPGSIPPPRERVEYPSVQGIEVQYSDGTSKFIPGDSQSQQTHTVAAGETLFSIAKKYGLVDAEGNTSTTALKQLNELRGNAISVGQVLRIPGQ